MEKITENLGIICYGNILRSQVLEQYIRHHAASAGIAINTFSAGVAAAEEFPDKDRLFGEIHEELTGRGIPHHLNRNPWDSDAEEKVLQSDTIICADADVMDTVKKRLGTRAGGINIHTFYQFINEGEFDFEDTYDYENNCQDPVRFSNAFDELERIARKIVKRIKSSK